MKIAVIGGGHVGGALGSAWMRAGHQVVFGGARGHSTTDVTDARSAPISEAVRDAEVAVLAVPWPAVPEVLGAVKDWSRKILIDCTNPIAPGLKLAIGFDTSGGETVARLAPGATVVKAFNTTGFGNMQNPVYGGKPLSMLFATDDPAARKAAEQLIRDVGFDPVFAGPLKLARYLEPMAMLWISMTGQRGLDFAFNVVRR